MGVVWHGVQEFGHALDQIDQHVTDASKTASLDAGKLLAGAASDAAPKISGDLAGSMLVVAKTFSSKPVVQVGPTIVYGRRVDIGFKGRKSARGVKKRRAAGIDTGRRGLQPTRAAHFMLEALNSSRDRIGQVYKAAWTKAISKF